MKFNKSSILGVLIAGILVGWGISYTNCGQEISEHESAGGADASDATNLTKGNTATPAYKGEKIPGVEFKRTDKGVAFVITDPKVKVEQAEGGFIFDTPVGRYNSICYGSCSGSACSFRSCSASDGVCGCPINDTGDSCSGECTNENRIINDNSNAKTTTPKSTVPGVVFKQTSAGEVFEITDQKTTYTANGNEVIFNTPQGKMPRYCSGRCTGNGCNGGICVKTGNTCGCAPSAEPGTSCSGRCTYSLFPGN